MNRNNLNDIHTDLNPDSNITDGVLADNIQERDYKQRDYKQRDYEQRDYEQRDYEQRDYEQRDYEQRDYKRSPEEQKPLEESNIADGTPADSIQERDYKRSPEEQKLLEEIKNLKSNREMRQQYAEKAYKIALRIITFWCVLFFVYFLSPPDKKPLNNTALGIFTTACTINILAAFISIIKGLFPHNK